MKVLIRKTTAVWTKEEGFSFLLVILVGTLFVGPLLKDWFPFLAAVGTGLFVLLFVVGAIVVSRNAWGAVGVSLLAGSSIALEVAHQISGVDEFASWRVGTGCLTMGVFTAVTLSRVFAPGPVTSHRLVGAVVAFLLVGLTCAFASEWLEVVRPGSFQTTGNPRAGTYPALLYYSFVTLTTVGYGDVMPVSPAARALSNVESLVGILYPAVLIGRLISRQGAGGAPGSDGSTT